NLQDFLDVLEVDEFVDYAVRITCNVRESCVLSRSLVQLVNRHDWKQLIDCPVIGERTKHREVAEVFRRQLFFQIVKFFGNVFRGLGELIRLLADLPEQLFTFGAVFKTDQSEIEQRKQFFLVLQSIVKIFAIVL